MRRILPVLLLCSTFSFAQVVVTNSGYATSPGPAVSGAQPFVPLVTTPSVDLQVQSLSPVGASSQNGSLQVGATSFPVYLPPQSMAITVPVWSNVYPTYGVAALPAMSATSQASEGQSGGSAPFDLGVGRASGLIVHTSSGPSVAEIAAQYRGQQVKPGHVYTNEDLKRFSAGTAAAPASSTQTSAPAANSGGGAIRYSQGVITNAPANSNATQQQQRSPFGAPQKKTEKPH